METGKMFLDSNENFLDILSRYQIVSPQICIRDISLIFQGAKSKRETKLEKLIIIIQEGDSHRPAIARH